MITQRRVVRRFAVVAVGAVLALAGLVVASPSASAQPICGQHIAATSIEGFTYNETSFELRRTDLEKGITGLFQKDPAAVVAPRSADPWCIYAPAFGSAFKVTYAFANGDRVWFEAWRYAERGPAGARCHVTGPTAADFRCSTRHGAVQTDHIWARFELVQTRAR